MCILLSVYADDDNSTVCVEGAPRMPKARGTNSQSEMGTVLECRSQDGALLVGNADVSRARQRQQLLLQRRTWSRLCE